MARVTWFCRHDTPPSVRPWLLLRRLPQAQLPQRAVDPQPRELLLHAILTQPRAQIVEIDAVEILALVKAGEHHAFGAACGIAVDLPALLANLLHHPSHRRVDGSEILMSGLV